MELRVGSSYRLQYRIGRVIFTIEEAEVTSIEEGDYFVTETFWEHLPPSTTEWRVPPASIVAAEALL